MIGLYVHVPFCASKCPYCDFYSIKHDEKLSFAYAEAVIRNIKFYNERYNTVYFGGGTPTLAAAEISRILANVRFSTDVEITIEANPGTVSINKLTMLHDSGINRISFGVQSFSNSELFHLGRGHTSDIAHSAINIAASVGYENISIDLMLGIPTQTPDSVRRSIKVLSRLPVNHVSAYMLKIEPNTPFAYSNLKFPSDDETALLYIAAVEALAEAGFEQYEISNFAKPGFECKHNLKYWRSEEYLGIGPAAHSYYDNERFAVDRDIKKFIKSEVQEVYITDGNPRTFSEFAMLKLRLSEGLTFKEIKEFDIDENLILANLEFIPRHYINVTNMGISITKAGFPVSNQIIGRLLEI